MRPPSLGAWSGGQKLAFSLTAIAIAVMVAVPLVVYAPTWLSTLYVLVLFPTPILALIWMWRGV